MTTFGRTGTGNASGTVTGTQYVSKFTMGGSNLTVVHAYVCLGDNEIPGKLKFTIYADSAGVPSTLIATSEEVTSFMPSGWVTFFFASPPTLTAGTVYWLGIHADTATTFRYQSGTGTRYSVSRSYASGPLSPWSGGTSASNELCAYVDDVASIGPHVLTQLPIEVASGGSGSGNAVLTQLAAEVASANALYAIMSQLAVEMISTNVPDDTSGRPQLFVIT